MRIVSLNAWGGAMFAELARWLPRSGADVLCLQEVTRTPGIVGWTSFEDGERALPQRANLFDDVSAQMPHHQGWFVASDAGPVRDREGHVHRQDFGLAVFVDRRIRTISHESSFVHGAFVDHEHWPSSDRPRLAQAIRFVDPASDGAAARAVTVVHALVSRARDADDLAVVCGDLNLMADSETFAVLRAIGLVDLVGRADTRTSRYPNPCGTRATCWSPTPLPSSTSTCSPSRRCPTIAPSCSTSDRAAQLGPRVRGATPRVRAEGCRSPRRRVLPPTPRRSRRTLCQPCLTPRR